MNNSGRVGDITASTGISSSKSGDSGRGKTSDVGAGRWAVGSISSSIRIAGISSISKSVGSIRISSISSVGVSKTSISISSIKESGISLSLGFTLGNMDNSGRVGDITASTGISSSNSRDSSRGKTSNAGASRGADGGISSSVRVSGISSISKSMGSIRISSISSVGVSKTKTSISISSIEKSGVSLSLSFTLGNMDNSGRVGDITASTGISTSYGRDSGRGKTSNAGASRGAD